MQFLKTAHGYVNTRYILMLFKKDFSDDYTVIYFRNLADSGQNDEHTVATSATGSDVDRLLGEGWDGAA